MDQDTFFGLDNTISAEDEGDVEYDADYDDLNDETFGSAAVDGDWEEGHKQFSSLTDAERSYRKSKVAHTIIPVESFSLRKLLNDDKPFDSNSFDKPRLFERNVNLGELSSSPGNSIWTPTQSLLTNNQRTVSDLESSLDQFHNLSVQNNSFNTKLYNGVQNNFVMPPPGLSKQISSIKTVEEIELEFKKQSLPSIFDRVNKTKPAAMTVEDLERMNAKSSVQTNVNTPNAQQLNFHLRPNQHGFFSNSHFSGSGMPRPNHVIPHHQLGSNHLRYQHFGNLKRPGLPFHPILNPHGNRPGMANNLSHHMHNGNLPPHRPMMPFNHRPPHNRMGDISKGFFPNGNQIRNPNFLQNNMGLERRNFEQNMKFDHMRNNLYERDQNNGHSSDGCGRVRRDSDAEWEEWQRIRQLDEYAGLMTPREKNWLRNIQGMQLQTDNPYQDDYYFVMHSVKHERKREEEVIELDGLQMLLQDRGKEGKEYEPPKLENSLGKLQVASVNAPRKIIDLEVVHLDSSHPTTLLQRDMRKYRTLLMHVEKMYDTMVELDDLQRKIRALPDCPTRDSFRSKCRQLVTKLWNELINPHENFVQILCIKKGKTLAARLMSWIGENEVEHLLATVIQNLSLLSKKDSTDKRLQLLWPIADRFFATRNASSIANFGIMMGPQLKIQKNSVVPALENKLGLSIVLSLLVRGENLWTELQEDDAWMQFLAEIVTGLSSKSSYGQLEPLLSVTLAASPKLPSIHIARSTKADLSELQKASIVLKSIESFLLKNTPTSLGQ